MECLGVCVAYCKLKISQQVWHVVCIVCTYFLHRKMVAKEDEAETCFRTTLKFAYQESLAVVLIILSVVLLHENCKIYGI